MIRPVAYAATVLVLLSSACGRSSQGYLERGKALAAEGKYEDASLSFRNAIHSSDRNGEAHAQLGLLLLRLNQPAEAYGELSRAVELLPGRNDLKVKLADVGFGIYVVDSHHPPSLYRRVTELADSIIKVDPYDGLRLKAHLAAADKNVTEAEVLFRKANEIRPSQPEIIHGLVDVLLQGSQPQSGEQLALKFIQREPSYRPLYTALLAYYLRTNRESDIENLLKLQLRNNPNSKEAILQLADFYAHASKEKELRDVLLRIENNRQQFPDAPLLVGDFYRARHRWDDALREYGDGAKLRPSERVTYLKRMAEVWLAEGKVQQADPLVAELLAKDPNDEEIKALRGAMLLATGTPAANSQAADLFAKLVGQTPTSAVWRFNYGRALAALGARERAANELQEAIKLQPSFLPPYLLLAELSQAKRDYAASIRYADRILALDPNMVRIRILRAASLMNLGRINDARGELAILSRDYPQDRNVRREVAALNLHDKEYAFAEERLRVLIQEDPKDFEAKAALVGTFTAQKKFEKALNFLESERKLHPDSPELASIAATTEMLAGRPDLAIVEYRKVLAGVSSAQSYLALGYAYRQNKDLSNAVSAFEKAAEIAPQDIAPFVLLSETLVASGQSKKALEVCHEGLKHHPDNPMLLNSAGYLTAENGGNLDEALIRGGAQYIGIDSAGARIEDNEFDGYGALAGTAVALSHGVTQAQIRGNRIRYTYNGITISAPAGYVAEDLVVQNNIIDLGWYLGNTVYSGSGDTVTYTDRALTDRRAHFPKLKQYLPIRVLLVRTKGKGVSTDGAFTQLADVKANFAVSGVLRGDLVKMGGAIGIVSSVPDSTHLQVEEWIEEDTKLPVQPTYNSYTVYRVVIGRYIESGSSEITLATLDGWHDWYGNAVMPSAGTLYEVQAGIGNYPIHLEPGARSVTITGNTVKRGYSDQISIYGTYVVVANNVISDGQDMGITLNGDHHTVQGNRIWHQGASGIYSSASDSTISGNVIAASTWMNFQNTASLGDVQIDASSTNTVVSDNVCDGVSNSSPWSTTIHRYGITLVTSGTIIGNSIYGNKCAHHTVADIELNGAGVSGNDVWGNSGTINVVNGASYRSMLR